MPIPSQLATLDVAPLVAALVHAALAALLACLAGLLLRMRPPVLSLIGAGLLGSALGTWIGGTVGGLDWPFTVAIGGASLHATWTFVGALATLFVARLVRTRRWR